MVQFNKLQFFKKTPKTILSKKSTTTFNTRSTSFCTYVKLKNLGMLGVVSPIIIDSCHCTCVLVPSVPVESAVLNFARAGYSLRDLDVLSFCRIRLCKVASCCHQ